MAFAIQKTNELMRIGPETPETHLSINMGGYSLLLYDLSDPDNPLELAFQSRYGNIICHKWFGDGHMMLGFSEGYLVVISTHITEIGEELFSGRFHAKTLYDIAYVGARRDGYAQRARIVALTRRLKPRWPNSRGRVVCLTRRLKPRRPTRAV